VHKILLDCKAEEERGRSQQVAATKQKGKRSTFYASSTLTFCLRTEHLMHRLELGCCRYRGPCGDSCCSTENVSSDDILDWGVLYFEAKCLV
jgi:hypothetical protein